MMKPIIVRQQLRDILINGIFPSKIVIVKGVSFEFTFTDDSIINYTTIIDCVEFLSKIIKCKVKGKEVPFTSLPGVYFYYLQTAYVKFQSDTFVILLDEVTKFIETAESKGLWLVYKNSNPTHVLSINHKLNALQQRWVILNSIQDNKNNMEMITDIFEVIKPWLDKELYIQIEKHAEKSRENVFFDDASYDTKLREKAKRLATSNQNKDSGDIIIMEEN